MSHYRLPLAFSLDIYILYKWARVRHVVFSEWTPFFFSFSYFSPSFGPSPASAQAASSRLRCAAAPLHTYETACKHTRSPVLFALQKMSYLYTFLHLAFLLIKCGENVLTSLIFFFLLQCSKIYSAFPIHGTQVMFFLYLYLFLKILFIFREGGEREKERERNVHVWVKHCSVASHTPPTGDLACNPGMCPDWELNWWLSGLPDDKELRARPVRAIFLFCFLSK